MSENLKRDFSRYDAMTTEALEEILRSDAEAPMGAPSDTDLLLYVMEVLADRRNADNIAGDHVQKAWESFEQNYMPGKPRSSAVVKHFKPWMRRLTAAAAAVVLLIAIPVSARALSLEKILDIFARWAKETFSFVSGENAEVSEPIPEDPREFASLQEMLQASNRDPSMIPTWIPDGFVLEAAEKSITPVQEIFVGQYCNGQSVLIIRVQNHLNNDSAFVETNPEYSEIYTVGEQDYYIFNNNIQTQAIWVMDSYECTISGDLPVEKIKMMIDSIGKG